MRKVLLTRNESGPDGTFGRIATDGMFEATTLELPWANNRPNVSAIPAGVFRCSLVDSPSKGRVYGVSGPALDGRTNILIHPANWAFRGEFGPQLLGCIAIGRAEGMVVDEKRGGAFRGIMSSRDAVISFMNDLTDFEGKAEDFQLTIVWGSGVKWDQFEPGY